MELKIYAPWEKVVFVKIEDYLNFVIHLNLKATTN